MKAVVQRVLEAACTVDSQVVGQIDSGLLVYLGICKGDTELDLHWLIEKIVNLRIFPDQEERMKFPITEIAGGILVISQFTLCADVSKGNRPSFTEAADPEYAEMMYKAFIKNVKEKGIQVSSGEFGAHMFINSENDGPVTVILDSKSKVG